ncbi:YraN family protein, partial [Candidatus Saccharibacteria bacterium]|nr:YraN family protein [Candidatus Saccharibacteria bacterium]
TEEHRRSFEPIRSMVGWDSDGDGMVNIEKNTTKIGGYGEDKVAEYLVKMGQEIVARNYKTRTYEIDIVSTIGDKIYFTEVKTRKDNSRGGGIYAVDIKKRVQMKFAAESFLAEHGEFAGYNPILAVADVDGVNMDVKNWVEIF